MRTVEGDSPDSLERQAGFRHVDWELMHETHVVPLPFFTLQLRHLMALGWEWGITRASNSPVTLGSRIQMASLMVTGLCS